MYISSEADCQPFIANDGCKIIELLHPKNFDTEADQALNFSLAIAAVQVNEETYHHVLEQHEVYYLLTGIGEMHIDNEVAIVRAGDAVLIPGGSVQWIKNVGDTVLRFAAIVSPPWSAADDHLIT